MGMSKAPMVLQPGLKGLLLATMVLHRAGEPGRRWGPSWIQTAHLLVPGQASTRFCLLSSPVPTSVSCPEGYCLLPMRDLCNLVGTMQFVVGNSDLRSVVFPDLPGQACISAALYDCILVTSFYTWRTVVICLCRCPELLSICDSGKCSGAVPDLLRCVE